MPQLAPRASILIRSHHCSREFAGGGRGGAACPSADIDLPIEGPRECRGPAACARLAAASSSLEKSSVDRGSRGYVHLNSKSTPSLSKDLEVVPNSKLTPGFSKSWSSAYPRRSFASTAAANPARYAAYGHSARSRSTRRIRRCEARVEAKEAATPIASERRRSAGTPRRRRRSPFSAVAPTMIGRAIVRESRLAWSREKPRQRAAARVTPLRETPGASAAAWAMPSARPSAGAGVAAPALLRPCVGDQHRRRPREQPDRRRLRTAEPLLDRALERVADQRRRQEGEAERQRPPPVEGAQLLDESSAAGRSAAPPRRRRAPRPRSSCAPPGPAAPSPSRRARG